MDKNVQDQIAQLQLIEQNMQQFHMQKQTLQIQLVELENALAELGITKETPFKVIGNIMVSCDKDTLEKDLKTKKETCEVRLQNVEKQEAQLKEKMEGIHGTLMKNIDQK